MSIKNIINNNINNTLTKKLLNNNYYNKSFIRSTLLSNKNLYIVDNYSEFFSLNNIEIENLINLKKQKILGNSIDSSLTIFRNVFNGALKFKLQSFIFSGFCSNFVNKFNFNLNMLYDVENKYKKVLILDPVKGGFSCYSLGFFGFLPKSQANVFFFCFLSKIKKSKKIYNLFIINICKKKDFIQKSFLFRFPLNIGKISIYSQKVKNNFSKRKKKKKKFLYNNINFVFLAKKKAILEEKNESIN